MGHYQTVAVTPRGWSGDCAVSYKILTPSIYLFESVIDFTDYFDFTDFLFILWYFCADNADNEASASYIPIGLGAVQK